MTATTLPILTLDDVLDRIAWDVYRPGQRRGIRLGIERMVEKAPYCSFCLPTRYGKSPMIRSLALIGKAAGLIDCSLALSPNEYLRNQLNAKAKWQWDINHFGLRSLLPGRELNTRTLLSTPKWWPNGRPEFAPEGQWFVSSTVQLAHLNQRWLELWIESHRTTGLPIAVFADETHMDGDGLPWGELLSSFADAGALVFPFTATPERADGKGLPGFRKVVISPEPIVVRRTSTKPGSQPQLIKVEIFEDTRQTIRLKADHETTFQEAWAETPASLCDISYIPFDIHLRKLVGPEDEPKERLLSELGVTEVRQQLGRLVRRPDVIRDGISEAIYWLNTVRRAKPDAGAVVFCQPNLKETDEEDRQTTIHIKEVVTAFAELAPQLRTVVAISANTGAKGSEVIDAFVAGQGDVLIVKNMASLGVDAPRVKVGLDLSAVRQYASYVQRLMRVATPFDSWLNAIWITPADILGEALFERVVSANGGDMSETLMVEKIKEYEREKEEKENSVYLTEGMTEAPASDTRSRVAEIDAQAGGRALATSLPAILQLYTFPQICEAAAALGIDGHQVPNDVVRVRDTARENAQLRKDLDRKADEIVNAWMHRLTGGQYDQQMWKELAIDLWQRAKARVGYRQKIDDDTPLSVLRALDTAFDELAREIFS